MWWCLGIDAMAQIAAHALANNPSPATIISHMHQATTEGEVSMSCTSLCAVTVAPGLCNILCVGGSSICFRWVLHVYLMMLSSSATFLWFLLLLLLSLLRQRWCVLLLVQEVRGVRVSDEEKKNPVQRVLILLSCYILQLARLFCRKGYYCNPPLGR